MEFIPSVVYTTGLGSHGKVMSTDWLGFLQLYLAPLPDLSPSIFSVLPFCQALLLPSGLHKYSSGLEWSMSGYHLFNSAETLPSLIPDWVRSSCYMFPYFPMWFNYQLVTVGLRSVSPTTLWVHEGWDGICFVLQCLILGLAHGRYLINMER